ncbi:hypothetical protein AZ021_004126 [Enterobacter ludwigii]|nr:hypothetical protein AZ021_004126 [Enterobacter ludwigii]
MPKGIRQITDLHGMPQRPSGENAVLEVADNRFAVNVIGIRLGEPRPDKHAFLPDQFFQPGPVIGIDGEKVIHHRHLPVKVIALPGRVLLQRLDDLRKVV